MLSRRVVAAAVVSLTVTQLTAQAVSAQTPEPPEVRRPYRGLFGGPPSSAAPHSLVATASAFAAYDDNVTEALSDRRVTSPWLQKSGGYQGANAGLAYTFNQDGERFDVAGTASAQLNYYRHDERSDALPAYSADILFGAQLTRSLTFTARQSASYVSTYNQALTSAFGEAAAPDVIAPQDLAFDLFEMPALRTISSLGLVQQVGRGLSLRGTYWFRTLNVDEPDASEAAFRDYESHSGSLGIHYQKPITRYATLQLGYGIRASDRRSRSGEPEFLHNVDVGVNYSRALSFSRRTSVSFGTGSAIAVSEPLDPATNERSNGRTLVRLIGRASLVHEIGRTWTAQLTYGRGFRNHDGFDQLYFTDAVDASIGGLISRRLSLSAGASWANSSLEDRSRGGRNGVSSSAQLQYGLTQFVAVYARYIYYHYRYSDNVTLDERFPRQLDRQGVRVGLTTSLPLIR